MSKNNRRQLIERSASVPETRTEIIPRGVAIKLTINFGFKHLRLDRHPFACDRGKGDSLLVIINLMILCSGMDTTQIGQRKNSHMVPDDQIKAHNLLDLNNLGTLHQIGKERHPERIIGFYDPKQINLFQVCLFDLNHNLSGD